MARRLLRKRNAPLPKPELPPGIHDAALVIAESIGIATAVVAAGVPSRRVWVLALPEERLHPGERAGFATEVAAAAGVVGGLLTDSEPARESLEAAVPGSRPRVVVFPPVAVDRTCPEHDSAATTGPARYALDPPDPAADPEQERVDPAVGLLARWRELADQPRAGAEVADSFAAARLRGTVGAWAAASQPGWQADLAGQRSPTPAGPEPIDWSSAAQVQAARRVWDWVTPDPPRQPRGVRAALLAGHDLKFARDLAERLGNRTDLTMELDEWRLVGRGTDQTEQRLRQAESIFAEWVRPSAVWYSQHKRPDQFLALRLHRYELDAPYPRNVAIDNVDAVVYIAPLFGRRIRDELGWPVDKLVYIPNYLDLDWFDRPKLSGARFALGLVGIEWHRKRFDLALDLLAALRREDHRFTLVVRSTMPWQNKYAWAEAGERAYVGQCFERIDRDPWLRHAVIFDPPGRDMARWYRRVGHVISTSDDEGCHTAIGEGMASGAVPVVRPWPGADEIYDKEWIYAGVTDAVGAVLANANAETWEERRARARAEIHRTYDPVAVVDAWADLLHGDVVGARRYFARYSDMSGMVDADQTGGTASAEG